jgi:hypothetical protein
MTSAVAANYTDRLKTLKKIAHEVEQGADDGDAIAARIDLPGLQASLSKAIAVAAKSDVVPRREAEVAALGVKLREMQIEVDVLLATRDRIAENPRYASGLREEVAVLSEKTDALESTGLLRPPVSFLEDNETVVSVSNAASSKPQSRILEAEQLWEDTLEDGVRNDNEELGEELTALASELQRARQTPAIKAVFTEVQAEGRRLDRNRARLTKVASRIQEARMWMESVRTDATAFALRVDRADASLKTHVKTLDVLTNSLSSVRDALARVREYKTETRDPRPPVNSRPTEPTFVLDGAMALASASRPAPGRNWVKKHFSPLPSLPDLPVSAAFAYHYFLPPDLRAHPMEGGFMCVHRVNNLAAVTLVASVWARLGHPVTVFSRTPRTIEASIDAGNDVNFIQIPQENLPEEGGKQTLKALKEMGASIDVRNFKGFASWVSGLRPKRKGDTKAVSGARAVPGSDANRPLVLLVHPETWSGWNDSKKRRELWDLAVEAQTHVPMLRFGIFTQLPGQRDLTDLLFWLRLIQPRLKEEATPVDWKVLQKDLPVDGSFLGQKFKSLLNRLAKGRLSFADPSARERLLWMTRAVSMSPADVAGAPAASLRTVVKPKNEGLYSLDQVSLPVWLQYKAERDAKEAQEELAAIAAEDETEDREIERLEEKRRVEDLIKKPTEVVQERRISEDERLHASREAVREKAREKRLEKRVRNRKPFPRLRVIRPRPSSKQDNRLVTVQAAFRHLSSIAVDARLY